MALAGLEPASLTGGGINCEVYQLIYRANKKGITPLK